MKRKDDPRHKARVSIVKNLFANQFATQYVKETTEKIFSKKKKIDALIAKNAPAWPLDQITAIDLAVLRLAVWELMIEKKEPIKVIVDEAVEIAKEYAGESSASFINGVLGTIIKTKGK